MRTPTQVVYVSGGRGGDGGPSYAGDAGHGGRGEGPRFEMRHNKISMYFNQEDQRKERKTILEWLSPINFLVRHQELSETRQRGTGEWILLHPVFLEWKSTPGKVLWCSGIPGAGKTVLASKIFDHLLTLQLKQDTIGLACIYLNYKDAETQTYKNLLAALWRQLVINQDMTPAQHLYSERHLKQGVTATLDDIGSLLVALVAQLSQVFIVLDALDEYSGDCDALVQQIQDLGANIHIIVMTRVHIVPPATLSILELEITAHQEDINTYVIAKLQDRRLKRFLNNNTALQVKILEQINQTADKMFLIVKLHMELLCSASTVKQLKEVLDNWPSTLSASYNLVLEKIEVQSDQDKELALTILGWVAYTQRPLSVAELQTALAFEKEEAPNPDSDALVHIDSIVELCCGLVILDKQSQVVRLVHYTTQHFLNEIQSWKYPQIQKQLSSSLMLYLKLARDYYAQDLEDNQDVTISLPLLDYCKYFITHITGEPEESLKDNLLECLQQIKETPKSWSSLAPWNFLARPDLSPLWIAVAGNLLHITEHMLSTQKHIVGLEIIVASYYGFLEMVQLLLKFGGNVEENDYWHGTPLQAASSQGKDEIVILLLDNGADINLVLGSGRNYGTALQAAVYEQHISTVQLLLSKGANVNQIGGYYGTALQAAASKGNINIIQLLIDQGADINILSGWNGTALQEASWMGHQAVVELLLNLDANPNLVGGCYGTPLQAAAAQENKDIIRLLLDKDAKINLIGGYYGAPLQAAAAQGNEEIFELLLEQGANVNAVIGEFGTALQAAVYQTNLKMIQLLLDKEADINFISGIFGTSLQAAVYKRSIEIVKILLAKGADVNLIGGRFGTALQAAAYKKDLDIIQLLFEAGSDVNLCGGEFHTALQAAAYKKHLDLVQLLLDKGAHINLTGGTYGTALQAASFSGRKSIVHLLLQRGADVNILGGDYGTALQAASFSGKTTIVQLLLEKDANVNLIGGDYETALGAALSSQFHGIARLLVEKGADIKLVNELHQTALRTLLSTSVNSANSVFSDGSDSDDSDSGSSDSDSASESEGESESEAESDSQTDSDNESDSDSGQSTPDASQSKSDTNSGQDSDSEKSEISPFCKICQIC